MVDLSLRLYHHLHDNPDSFLEKVSLFAVKKDNFTIHLRESGNEPCPSFAMLSIRRRRKSLEAARSQPKSECGASYRFGWTLWRREEITESVPPRFPVFRPSY